MPEITIAQFLLLFIAASGIGLSKSGFAGISMVHVIVFAFVFDARASTGILLPLLVFGDVCAVLFFGPHVQWHYVRRLMPPALIGVVGGWAIMVLVQDDAVFKPIIGGIILILAVLQMTRIWRPDWFEHIPHAHWFAWTLGLLAGVSTMMANAAGSVVAIYLLSVSLPKYELVGTNAWFFLLLNMFKIPFSYHLGLIYGSTLLLDLLLAPAIVLGICSGRWLICRIPQRVFDSLLLILTAFAAMRLIFA